MRRLSKSVVAAMIVLGIGAGHQARAQFELFGGVSSTVTTVVTTAGVVVLIVFLVRKKPAEEGTTKEEATKAAQLFLQQNKLQLAQDLNSGRGPLIDELGTALNLRADNKARFGKVLRTNRAGLLQIAQKKDVSLADARSFTHKLVEIMDSDPALSADLHAYANAAQVN